MAPSCEIADSEEKNSTIIMSNLLNHEKQVILGQNHSNYRDALFIGMSLFIGSVYVVLVVTHFSLLNFN